MQHKDTSTNSIMISCTKNIVLALIAIYLVVMGIQFILASPLFSGFSVENFRLSINSFFVPMTTFIKENLLTLFTGWGLFFLLLFNIFMKLEENKIIVPKILSISLFIGCFIGTILFFVWSSSLTTQLSVLIVGAVGVFFLGLTISQILIFLQERKKLHDTRKANPEQFELFRKRKLF